MSHTVHRLSIYQLLIMTQETRQGTTPSTYHQTLEIEEHVLISWLSWQVKEDDMRSMSISVASRGVFALLVAATLMHGAPLTNAADPFTSEPSLVLEEPTPIVDHWFGFALAAAGDEILVSSVDYTVEGKAHLFDAQTGALLRTFAGPPGLPLDSLYGYALLIAGDHVFVAAPEDSATHVAGGTVFRYDRIAGGAPDVIYRSPSPGNYHGFGAALAVGQGHLFVGEPYANGTGAVHVYDLASGSTTPLNTLTGSTFAGADFGIALSVIGDVLAVGAPWDSNEGTVAGAVYLFDADSGSHLQTLRITPPALYEGFGDSLSGTATKILIGAPLYPDAGGDRPGAAYIFEGDRSSPQFGQLLHRLDNPTPAHLERFGQTVAGVGEHLLVGAYYDDTCAPGAGAAYLFDQTGALLQTFIKTAPCENDVFSAALTSAGGNVLIGAIQDDRSGLSDAGAAYLFGNTPMGEQVAADVTSDDETEISLTFTEVLVPGVTTAKQVECAVDPSNSTFEICDPPVCQDITTTAIFKEPTETEPGGIEVCIGYGASGCPTEGDDELGIRLYQENEDGSLEDITTEVIAESDIVCGLAPHLSLFEVVQSRAPRYVCMGFEPPMDDGTVTVRGNRTIPFKFDLFSEDGSEMAGNDLAAAPTIRVFLTAGGGGDAVDVTDASLPAGLGTEGNAFVYTGNGWQYNLKTSEFREKGTYTVLMTSGDEAEYLVEPTCVAWFEIQ